jgi:hypothetical protein
MLIEITDRDQEAFAILLHSPACRMGIRVLHTRFRSPEGRPLDSEIRIPQIPEDFGPKNSEAEAVFTCFGTDDITQVQGAGSSVEIQIAGTHSGGMINAIENRHISLLFQYRFKIRRDLPMATIDCGNQDRGSPAPGNQKILLCNQGR